MRFPAAAVLAPLFSLLTAVPCFAQGLFDDNEARRRVEALRQQLLEQNRLMEERMTKMETALAGASDRSAMLDIASQIEALRGDIAKMRGQLEVATNQIEVADKRQKDLYLDIDTRIRKLEQANEQAALLQQQQQQQAQPPGGTQPAESQQAGEMRAYQAALALGDAGLSRPLPEQLARAERPVLDRHGALRPARLQERDRRAAQAPRVLARKREGARRAAEHRELPGNHGRPQERAEDARGSHPALPEEQRRREREAAPRRVQEGLSLKKARQSSR